MPVLGAEVKARCASVANMMRWFVADNHRLSVPAPRLGRSDRPRRYHAEATRWPEILRQTIHDRD